MADTHPGHGGNAETLHRYWVHGEGAARIRWGTPGDFDRCTRQLIEHAQFTPEEAHGYCNLAHHAALGFYPATHAAMEKGHGRAQVTQYTRSFPLEDISIRAGDGRTVDAYAAVFDVPTPIRDQDGDYDEIIDRSAFNKAIADAAPAGGRERWRVGVFYNHGRTIWNTPSDLYSMPVGVPVEIRADGRGLFTRTKYLPGQLGDQILEAIREGSISGYSFSGAFSRSDPTPPLGGFPRKGKRPTVKRLESSLREYGPTPFPAYADAAIVGMRAEQAAMLLSSMPADEFERFAAMFRAVTVQQDPGTSEVEAATEAPPQRHAARSPHEEYTRVRGRFLIESEGRPTGA